MTLPVPPSVTVVIPTIARPSLARLLASLDGSHGPSPECIVVVDDRAAPPGELAVPARIAGAPVVGLRSHGRGPAAARNRGAAAAATAWVAFLDDDVEVSDTWLTDLACDLRDAELDPQVAGSQGRIRVPGPDDRRPTDWERDVAGLERAVYATADLAYRRDVLRAVGGFDEGFPGAYREDADLALRILDAGRTIRSGTRTVRHPPGPSSFWTSVRRQRSNAADARMRGKHGRGWRARASAPRGRLPVHLVTVAAAGTALVAAGARRSRLLRPALLAWSLLTAQFAWCRIAPGPRTPGEVARMLATSVAIPFTAVAHRARGEIGERRWRRRTRAVLFDRDGTLIVDVPDNVDPERVQLTTGAGEAVGRLRAAGVPVGIVTNQAGVAHGRISHHDVRTVHRRVDELLGPLDGFWYCPHGEGDTCSCRKPAPGMVTAAAIRFGAPPHGCVVVGDTEADVTAARVAGAHGVLVPNERTLREEIDRAAVVAADLRGAVDHILDRAARR
jgi:histidinol-phosphate phosphatase family protein